MPEIFEDGGMFEYREAIERNRQLHEDMTATEDMVVSWLREEMTNFVLEHPNVDPRTIETEMIEDETFDRIVFVTRARTKE